MTVCVHVDTVNNTLTGRYLSDVLGGLNVKDNKKPEVKMHLITKQ